MAPLDRRELLGIASAAPFVVGASRLAAGAKQDGEAPRRDIKKSCKIGMVQGEGLSLKDKFQILVDAGFHGVELDSPSELTEDEVLAAKEATGLEVPGVVDGKHWQWTLGDPNPEVRGRGRAALEGALVDCKRWGGTSVLLVPAVVNKRISYDQAYIRSQAEIRKVLPLASQIHVDVNLENVWNNFLLSPLEAARYVDELDSDHVGWYMDIGNVVTYGWPEQWIRLLGKRIKRLDIKEFSRKKRDAEGRAKGFDVEIGDGDCDWPAVMAALDEIGYAGWASAEVRGGDPARLKDISERMDRILAS